MTDPETSIDVKHEHAVQDPAWAAWFAVKSAHRRQWREALLRRMLALADTMAALLVSVSLATFLPGDLVASLWSAAILPIWILLAKLHGQQDPDGKDRGGPQASHGRRGPE